MSKGLNSGWIETPFVTTKLNLIPKTLPLIASKLFEKSDVRGKKSNSVYKWLSSVEENGWNDKAPRWNFFKYLVDGDGSLKAVYSSNTNPLDKEILDFVLN